MDRRLFLQTVGSLAAAGVPALAIQKQKQERVLTTHQEAVMRVMQNNMRQHAKWSGEVEDRHLIDVVFPDQWKKLKLLDVAGVSPALGPCNLLFIENGPAFPVLVPYLDSRVIEHKQDWLATDRCVRSITERHRCLLDEPQFENPRLKKMSYVVRSSPFDRPDGWSAHIDKAIVGSMAYVAVLGTWDVLNRVPKPYVLCSEADERVVRWRTGLKPVVFDFITPGEAYIGFKESEYHASFYFMPYVPIVRGKNGYITRYGFISGDDWMFRTAVGAGDQFWRVAV